MITRGKYGIYPQRLFVTALVISPLLFLVTECRTADQGQFYWKTDEWGTCFVADACGFGIRERSVWCAERDTDKTALEYSCKAVDEPPRTKQCFIACRHHRGHLEWQTSDWGVCVVPTTGDIEEGNEGIMERNVSCVLTAHNHTQVSIVIDDENCLSVGKRPSSTSKCTLPTRQECVLSEWTEWTPCCNSKQWRIRSVLVAPHYGAHPCPQLSEWRTCADEYSAECDTEYRPGGKEADSRQTRLRVERWGDCKPNLGELEWDGDSSGHADNYYKHWPQVGTQRRAITCLSTTGSTLDLTECLNERNDQGLPMRERACIISQDCSVSEWSEWEVIQEGCIDPNGNEWPEITERKREVLRLHEGQGKNCPHLIENKDTKLNLPLCSHKYRWVTSKWSGCTLPGVIGTVVCGGGLQFKNISCVKADSGQPVPSEKCKAVAPPPTVQRCEVACARDCEVSQWGAWSPCKPYPNVCSTSEPPASHPPRGQRIRQRSVVVAPSDLGLECPSLIEVQPCLHPKCYVWKIEPWSSCYLLNIPQAKCGSGTRNRKVTCVTHEEEPVPDSFCSELKPQVKESCLIPCPYDCVVSPWSSWTPCSRPCSMGMNVGLHSRNRTIIAPPGQDGHICPPPDEFMEIEPCNLHGCHGYSWLTLPWQDCNATCDREGYQFREIWCVDNQERVPDGKCITLKRPEDIRPCTKECPAECQVSPWSEWSTCSHTCYPNGTRGIILEQVRYRVVLEGLNCGPLIETSPCPPAPLDPCPTYSWTTGNWSHCLLATGVRCGHGLRTRDLWCTNDQTGERVELRFCLKNQQNSLPVSIQRCHADCHSPCQLTEWSSWSACKQPCQGGKERTRQLIGLSGRHEVCKGLPLRETMSCPCSENYQEYLSEWSPCLTNETSLVGDTGARYKAIGCFDKKGGQLVDPSLCGGSSGLVEEPCMISRPVDCVLGEWSPWGDCSVPCGPGLHSRTREIERNASHGGRPCGDIVETKVCDVPCDAFQWQTGGWSECQLLATYKILGCGNGEQSRQIRCVDIRTNTQIQENMCDWTTKPASINTCHVACPGDCVLSPWSDWSICPKGCLENSYQQRTRTELRAAANNGAHCPRSIQTQACQLNVTCFTYQWAVTNFSSCLPLGGSPCGEGVTNRAVYCLRSDNRPVADSWCSEMQKPEPSEKWCYKECPVDCQISEWSEWNISKCHCGQSAGMTRHATIRTNPSSTGRPCPELFQWKPCPVLPCYSWAPSEWTTCQLHGAACGHGVRTRNVSCIRVSDNATVESWHCSGARRPSVWETCHSPCDTDCLLSEWSPWSDCHATCDKDKLGYQTRSRAVIRPPASAGAEPCPEALWETQPCEPGPCYTYDWVVTATGDIICTRSDGLHVIGGCNEKHKPKPAPCRWINEKCVCDDGAIVLQQNACASDSDGIQAKIFFPNDDLSFWMFAMIGIGCVFIIFVAASIYLLCNSSRETGSGYHPAK